MYGDTEKERNQKTISSNSRFLVHFDSDHGNSGSLSTKEVWIRKDKKNVILTPYIDIEKVKKCIEKKNGREKCYICGACVQKIEMQMTKDKKENEITRSSRRRKPLRDEDYVYFDEDERTTLESFEKEDGKANADFSYIISSKENMVEFTKMLLTPCRVSKGKIESVSFSLDDTLQKLNWAGATKGEEPLIECDGGRCFMSVICGCNENVKKKFFFSDFIKRKGTRRTSKIDMLMQYSASLSGITVPQLNYFLNNLGISHYGVDVGYKYRSKIYSFFIKKKNEFAEWFAPFVNHIGYDDQYEKVQKAGKVAQNGVSSIVDLDTDIVVNVISWGKELIYDGEWTKYKPWIGHENERLDKKFTSVSSFGIQKAFKWINDSMGMTIESVSFDQGGDNIDNFVNYLQLSIIPFRIIEYFFDSWHWIKSKYKKITKEFGAIINKNNFSFSREVLSEAVLHCEQSNAGEKVLRGVRMADCLQQFPTFKRNAHNVSEEVLHNMVRTISYFTGIGDGIFKKVCTEYDFWYSNVLLWDWINVKEENDFILDLRGLLSNRIEQYELLSSTENEKNFWMTFQKKMKDIAGMKFGKEEKKKIRSYVETVLKIPSLLPSYFQYGDVDAFSLKGLQFIGKALNFNFANKKKKAIVLEFLSKNVDWGESYGKVLEQVHDQCRMCEGSEEGGVLDGYLECVGNVGKQMFGACPSIDLGKIEFGRSSSQCESFFASRMFVTPKGRHHSLLSWEGMAAISMFKWNKMKWKKYKEDMEWYGYVNVEEEEKCEQKWQFWNLHDFETKFMDEFLSDIDSSEIKYWDEYQGYSKRPKSVPQKQ